MAPTEDRYEWRITRAGVWDLVGFAGVMGVVFPMMMFFAAGAPADGQPARGLEYRLLTCLAMSGVLLIFPVGLILFVMPWRLIADASGLTLTNALGRRTRVDAADIRGVVTPRLLQTSTSIRMVQIERMSGRLLNIRCENLNGSVHEIRAALSRLFASVQPPESESERRVFDHCERMPMRPMPARLFIARRRGAFALLISIVLVTLWTCAYFITRNLEALGPPGQDTSKLNIYVYALGCAGCFTLVFPWLFQMLRGGRYVRLEIEREQITLAQQRRVQRLNAADIAGVTLHQFNGALRVLVEHRERRRSLLISEADFRCEPGEIAADLLCRFGQRVHLSPSSADSPRSPAVNL